MIYENTEYTLGEYNVVSDATLTASTYLDSAVELLDSLYSDCFEQSDVDLKSDSVAARMYGIMLVLHNAKLELDVFANPYSDRLKAHFDKETERKAIVERFGLSDVK